MIKHHFAALAALLLLTAPANATPAKAQALAPIQAQRIELGEVAGTAYYTVEPDGFHVVATFAHGETDANPLRVGAVLAAGQSVVFSKPGVDGTAPASIRIARQGDTVVVVDGSDRDGWKMTSDSRAAR